MRMKYRKAIRYLKAVLLCVVLVCLFRLGHDYCLSVEHQKEMQKLKSMAETETLQEDAGAAEQDAAVWEADSGGPESEEEETKQTDSGKAQADDGVEQETEPAQSDSEPAQTDSRAMQEAGDDPQAYDSAGTSGGSGIPGEEGGHLMLDRYKALYKKNSDLAGWLSVEGMKIDYPVMQCADDEFYLHHDFDREESKYGCLYVRERADLEEGTNFIIYGHNMKDGSMFGDLDLYREEDFYREHPRIAFDTLYAEHSYEVIAVFLSQVYTAADDVFKYYEFYEVETEEEFNDFYDNIKAMSLYDTGVEAEFGDTFLTLSTCAYHVKNGRLAVVAKRVE